MPRSARATHAADERGTVRFQLHDASLPTPAQLLDELWGDHVLEGSVVAHSRAAGDARCVVVKVPGLEALVVVMTTDLLSPSEV